MKVSRKLARSATFSVVLILCLLALPGPANTRPAIRTTQKILVLDPGHGGRDTGIVSVMGHSEKTITLMLARQIAKQLDATCNIILTRTEDIALDDIQRMEIANQYKADLFVSIHLQTPGRKRAAIFHFAQPGILPEQKSSTLLKQWPFLPLAKLTQSRLAAKTLLKHFSSQGSPAMVSAAPLNVLEGAGMPAILVEPFSIESLPSAPEGVKTRLEHYAGIISQGIRRYFTITDK